MQHEKLSRSVERTVLDNGARVLSSFARNDTAAFGFGFNIGTIFDPPGLEELFHMVEHLLLKAAPGYPQRRAMRILEKTGECTAHTMQCQILVPHLALVKGKKYRKNFRKAFRVLSKLVAQPTFTEQEFLLERDAVEREMEERASEPAWHAYDFLYQTLFGAENPIARKTVIDPQDVRRLSYETVLSYCQSLLEPNLVTVVGHGSLPHRSLVRAADAFFRRHEKSLKQKGVNPRHISLNHKQDIERSIRQCRLPDPLVLKPEPRQSDRLPADLGGIALGCRLPSFKTKYRYALEVLRCILGGHEIDGKSFLSGDVFYEVREKRGHMYHPNVIDYEVSPLAGCFCICIQTNSSLLERVEETLLNLFRTYRRDGISQSIIEDAKARIETHFAIMASDYKFDFLEWMLDMEIGGAPEEICEHVRNIRKTTRREVLEVIEKFFDPETQIARTLVYPNSGEDPAAAPTKIHSD
ncbi:MAG: insulinase family protein [Candidatus Sungbacteria bacterium]|nr:insulinase family protein [Candidatus Sungbacteria bacterium]